jgi:hypothetical protein
MLMSRSGRLIGLAVCSLGLAGCCSHGGENGKEVAVTMGELPAAVRATLDRESAGGQVTEIEREMKKGRTIYSADLTVNGQAWDISIAEDGTVISKEREKHGEK